MDKVIKGGTEMTIGVDLGDKWSRLCVLDEHGEVCEEGRIATTAQAMRKRFSTEAPCRIVIEVGTHSPWVQRLLEELGDDSLTFGMSAGDIHIKELSDTGDWGSGFRLQTPWGEVHASKPLPGRFNLYNVMAAVGTCGLLGLCIR